MYCDHNRQDELDEYYNSVREGLKKRKQERDDAHKRVADYLPEEEAEEKRGINWQIQKNKGLTPHRKINNPRVKHKVWMVLFACFAVSVCFSVESTSLGSVTCVRNTNPLLMSSTPYHRRDQFYEKAYDFFFNSRASG